MTKSTFRILAVAGDAGGAAAIAPVVQQMQQGAEYAVLPFTYRQATQVFQAQGLAQRTLSESMTVANFEALLRTEAIQAVLCGTSVNGIDLEKKCIQAARNLRIPSLAVLDFWSNYRVRFAGPDRQLSYLPDRIAVMDERAKIEMLAAGFPSQVLRITGQPAFDRLADWTPERVELTRCRVRRDLQLADNERLIAFFSQPLEDFYGADTTLDGHPGFTEKTAFSLLMQAVALAEQTGPETRHTIVIRTHPREDAKRWQIDSENIPKILLNPPIGTSLELAATGDLVAGMNSVILLEAALIGKQVLSLQPNLRRESALPPNQAITVSVGDGPEQVAKLLQDARPSEYDAGHEFAKAVPRVLAVVFELLKLSTSNRDSEESIAIKQSYSHD